MPTFRLNQSLSGDAGNLNPIIEAEAENAQTFTVVLAADAADVPVDVAFDKDRLKGFVATGDADFVIKTNSDETPGQTLNIGGDTGLAWVNGMPLTNPFSVDVTAFYLTNSDDTNENAVTFKILYDATP